MTCSGGYVLNWNVCGSFVLFGPSADGVPAGISTVMFAFGGNSSVALNASHLCLLFSSLLAPSTMFLSVLFFWISASVSKRSSTVCVPASGLAGSPAVAHGSGLSSFLPTLICGLSGLLLFGCCCGGGCFGFAGPGTVTLIFASTACGSIRWSRSEEATAE